MYPRIQGSLSENHPCSGGRMIPGWKLWRHCSNRTESPFFLPANDEMVQFMAASMHEHQRTCGEKHHLDEKIMSLLRGFHLFEECLGSLFRPSFLRHAIHYGRCVVWHGERRSTACSQKKRPKHRSILPHPYQLHAWLGGCRAMRQGCQEESGTAQSNWFHGEICSQRADSPKRIRFLIWKIHKE